VNEPIGEFGARPINRAAKNLAVIDVLLEFGADINLRSDWDKGPFGVLDSCREEDARELIARGATLTPHAAARFGWIDELRVILDAKPQAVNDLGGDGQRPLHYSKTPEIAAFLLERGAEIDARCVDHHSTAAQYALADRPDVTTFLLNRQATADIFMPARLGDAALAKKLIEENPNCLAARVNIDGYDRVPRFNIYCWTLGFYMSPHEVALKFEHRDVYELLWKHSSPKVRLLEAAMRADEPAARQAIREDSTLPSSLMPADHALLAHAVFQNREAAAKLMLELGFDPMARGQDGGTALHMAAWVANLELIDKLLARGADVNAIDPTHGSTVLGWAAYGSVHRRREGADYVAAVERLVAAGADVKSPGNKFESSLLQMAEGNPQVQEALRRLGAT
jgi:ankyrin repeat protein